MASTQLIRLPDKKRIYKGSRKTVKATFTDDEDAAATPTDAIMTFIPPSGNSTVYKKNPGEGEETFTRFNGNVGEVDFLFDESGTWKVVASGLGNIEEVVVGRINVAPVPS